MCSIACVFIFWALYFSVRCRNCISNVNLRGYTMLLDSLVCDEQSRLYIKFIYYFRINLLLLVCYFC